jgi:RNA polymerase sigma-B factor
VPATPPQLDERFAELRRTGDLRLRSSIVHEYGWLAEQCAGRFRRRGEPHDDLVQVAYVGLVKAVDRYDPSRQAAFTSFAIPTILGELRRHFRDTTWPVHVSRRGKELYGIVANVVDELTATLGRSPTIQEVADWVGLDLVETLQAFEIRSAYRGVSLEPAEPEDRADPADAHRGAALGTEEAGFDLVEGNSVVTSLIEALPTELDRTVVALRFLRGCSQADIAQRVGVSQVQVSRLLRANIERMRRRLAR